jgi:hypothetical protein
MNATFAVTFVIIKMGRQKAGLILFARLFFDVHILEFAGLENFAAILAFHEFGILIAADNLHAKVLAGLGNVLRRRGRL